MGDIDGEVPTPRWRTRSTTSRPEVGSPLWWVARLYTALVARAEEIEVFDNYYSGNHPLPWLAPQAQEDFRRILRMTRSNYMGLVCDAMVERMAIEGFRVGTKPEGDSATWTLWQRNNMDAEYSKCLLEAAIGGRSYLLVAPNPARESEPFIWVEHASQCIVEHVPGTNRRERAAALKVWEDDWTGDLFATLYLPEAIYKFRARNRVNGQRYVRPEWTERHVAGETWPLVNTLEVVPMFEAPNNPRLLTGGVSELVDLLDIQDRVNKTIADRMLTQDYGAFPQKWATAWPEVDEAGNALPAIRVGRDRMITTDVAETKFGQFQSAALDPYNAAKREDVKDIASRSRTPAQYLLGEMSNVNGETLKASESGLVSKVRQRSRGHSDPVEDAARLLRKAAGLSDVAGDEAMEAIWRNPEFRTEGELVDALVKMSQLHVPDVALWERWGATPQEIARWMELQKEQAKRADLLAMMADKYRAPADVSPYRAQTDRGSTSNTTGSGGDGRAARDADGDGTVNEKSNRDTANATS